MTRQQQEMIGLCRECRYHSIVLSGKGKQFHLCEVAKIDPAFPKYPRLPVLRCKHFSSINNTNEQK